MRESNSPAAPPGGFRVAADIGGTFTDIAAIAPDGALATAKLLSTPGNYADAVIAGMASLCESLSVSTAAFDELLHGCTVATNAILEHKGARTALVTTTGFRDVLELRRIRTPRLYAPLWEKPPPLVPRHLRFEIDERIGADGSVVQPLAESSISRLIDSLKAADAEAIAVCLINAFANDAHERRIGERIRDAFPTSFVTVSTEVLPQMREYERTSTTVINAYVGPPVRRYLQSMIEQVQGSGMKGRVLIMQSSGGVLTANAVLDRPAEIIECGPAAGVIGARQLGRRNQYANIITFDMGGTTAKASLIEEGNVARSEEYEVGSALSGSSALTGGAGYSLKLPVIDIAEVGAGGGSIVRIDKGGAIKVGPDSAGASPGPMCYRLGGAEPTVTDANVVLGYLNPTALAGDTVPIDANLARDGIGARIASPLGRDVMETAYGIHLVANTNMMRAVKAVTTHRGRDPREFVLFAFGGSGGVHAASLARELRIGRIVVPAAAGVFSALGLLYADMALNESRAFLHPISAIISPDAETVFADLQSQIRDRLQDNAGLASFSRYVDLRYRGQAFELTIPIPTDPASPIENSLTDAFNAEHARRYGHCFESQYPLELVNLRVVGAIKPPSLEARATIAPSQTPTPTRDAYFGPEFGVLETRIVTRGDIAKTPAQGPVIVEEYEGTAIVPPDARIHRADSGDLIIDLDGR
ncbi:MAG: hydantoinase/oxoprolinase family protein [Pseudomonadota bacterium]